MYVVACKCPNLSPSVSSNLITLPILPGAFNTCIPLLVISTLAPLEAVLIVLDTVKLASNLAAVTALAFILSAVTALAVIFAAVIALACIVSEVIAPAEITPADIVASLPVNGNIDGESEPSSELATFTIHSKTRSSLYTSV